MTIFEKINQMNVEDMAKFLFWIKNLYNKDYFKRIYINIII